MDYIINKGMIIKKLQIWYPICTVEGVTVLICCKAVTIRLEEWDSCYAIYNRIV